MGAGINAFNANVLLTIYPPEKRGAAMGMSGLVIGLAPAIGPTLSGFIIDQLSWRYLFYTVFPITIVVLLLAIFLMKNVTEQKKVNVDMISITLSTLGWGGLLYGFSIVGSVGWNNPYFIGSIFIGIFTLILFIRRQHQAETPMLNFKVFQYKEFTITTILSVLMFSLMISIETLLPFYVQNVREGSALQSGALLLPGALITGFMSPVAGRIFDKHGAKWMAILGFLFMLIATNLYLSISMNTPFIMIAIIFAIKMFGVSLLMTPLMTSGINALPFHLIPHGTAMSNTIRMVGASIGTALIVSVMSVATKSSQAGNPSHSMLEGMHASFIITGIIALIGLVLSFSLHKKSKSEQIAQ